MKTTGQPRQIRPRGQRLDTASAPRAGGGRDAAGLAGHGTRAPRLLGAIWTFFLERLICFSFLPL